jgi:hypothetical protein
MDLLAGHLLGDILLQNGKLAKIKTESVFGMLLHCLLYTFGIWVFSQWGWQKLVIVLTTHFLIDYFGIGKNIYPNLVKMGNPKDLTAPIPMWLGLLCDQSFHIIILALINKI